MISDAGFSLVTTECPDFRLRMENHFGYEGSYGYAEEAIIDNRQNTYPPDFRQVRTVNTTLYGTQVALLEI
jgi:hypothetical protein